MRIALVTHKVGFQDGQGRVNYEIAKAALQKGHKVTVVGQACAPEIAGHPNGSFVCLLDRHLPTQMLRDQYFAFRSARWLRKHRSAFDIVQANGFVTWQPADVVAVHYVHAAWLRNRHYPFRWSSFSPYAYYQRLNTLLNKFLELRAFRSARRVVAVSGGTARDVESLGISPKKISVVYNGVDPDEFSPGPAIRDQFGLPEDVPLALFIGDIRTPRKGLPTVLLSMLKIPQMHLAIAGDAAGSPYPAMASRLGLSDRTHFLGKQSEVQGLMRSSDYFVLPSRYEAHPLVLMEAMATGTPVIVSDGIGASAYLGGAGIVFGSPDDADALSDAMQRLTADPECRRQMSEAGREIALSMQWSHTAAGYLKVYEDLLRGRSSPPQGNGSE